MRKPVAFVAAITFLSTSALAQVRPEDCVPVFPLVDQVAAAPEIAPQDVLAERAAPVTQSRRGFFGLPLLPLVGALAGAGALIGGGGGGGGIDISPA